MREIKGGGRITVCRPAHDRQSSSEDLPEPVSDRPPGRVKQHARPRETHDASHLFPHGRPVTMNGTAAATRFRFAENASVQPVVRIPDQGGAFGARYRISLNASVFPRAFPEYYGKTQAVRPRWAKTPASVNSFLISAIVIPSIGRCQEFFRIHVYNQRLKLFFSPTANT